MITKQGLYTTWWIVITQHIWDIIIFSNVHPAYSKIPFKRLDVHKLF